MPTPVLPPVEIKRFELADEEALLAFLRVAFADDPRRSDPGFWRWQFLDNPYVSRDDVPIWVVKSEGRIVGQIAGLPVHLKVGTEITRAMWMVDLVVSDEFRRRGLGTDLIKAASESCPIALGLGLSRAVSIHNRLRASPLGHLHRYQKFLFPGHAVRELAARPKLRGLVNFVYAPFRPRLTSPADCDSGGGTITEVDEFDASFDALWQEAASQWVCIVAREARYLDWQFRKQPKKQFNVLALRRGGRLAGYVVVFFHKAADASAPPKAAVSDLLYGPQDSAATVGCLLDAALNLAIERRAGSLVVDVRDETVERELRRRRFWRIKKSAPEFRAYVRVHQSTLANPANWFLTRSDSDVSVFERPNL